MASGEAEKKRTVPKFSSFKPKPVPASAASPPEAEAAAKAEPDQKHAEGDEAKRATHRRHGDRHRSGSRREQEGRSLPPPPQPPPPARSSEMNTKNNVYFIDKRGDPLIQKYGNDRAKVPSYRRFGAGKVLGADGFLSVHYEGSREQFSITPRYRDRGSIFRDKKALAAAASWSAPKHIKPSRSAGILPTADDDFIALEPSRKRRRLDRDAVSRPDYRSIYGNSKDAHSDPDSDSDDASTDGGDATVEMTATKKRSIELSRQVRANPEDIPSWLALIELQDSLFRENLGDAAETTAAPRLSTAEEAKALAGLKLTLYEEALSHAVRLSEKETFLLGVMREGARVWDPKALLKRWDEVSKEHGESFELWRARLNFELVRMATCTYEDAKTFIMDRLHILRKGLTEAYSAASVGGVSKSLMRSCSQLIYVFLRLTCFLRDAGYQELAAAAWQAELELTFCRPTTMSDSGEEAALDSLAGFWESEVPRMGEDGARGWQHFDEAPDGMTDPPEPRSSGPRENPQTRDKYKAWALVELDSSNRSRLPARTLDDGAEDDPFRVVMFSDIKDFLVWFPAAVVAQVSSELLDAFLLFCGLPTACLSSGLVHDSSDDPFIAGQGEAFEAALSVTRIEQQPTEERKKPEFRQQGGSLAFSHDVLFPGKEWFRYLDSCCSTRRRIDSPVEISWVLGSLRYLVRQCRIEELAEYYLALEWLSEPAGARKAAKGLLKQFSSNLGLYSAYALIEWANGNAEVSEKVLSASTGRDLNVKPASGQLLWNTWAWMSLESGQRQAALAKLCCSVDMTLGNSAPSPALLLKAGAHFANVRDYSLSSQDLEVAIQHAESHALLEYLSAEEGSEATSETQGSITAALSSIRHFSGELVTRNMASSPYHERILQTAARLLYYHATHGPYRPIYLRTHLLQFIALFPRNTLFLSLFAWAEPSIRIDDPVRAALQRAVHPASEDRLSTRRFAIAHEARTSTAHSTRAALESALDTEACRGNVDLWLCYIRLCCARKELRGIAKGVFHRALAACPLSKAVYMEAFSGALVKELSSAELRAVYETMITKGLRVHVDMEEWIGKER